MSAMFQRYAAVPRVFQHALQGDSERVRSQVCRATLKEIAAKYFLWSDALGVRGAHLELRHFPSLQSQIERMLLTVVDLIVYRKSPGSFTLTTNCWPLRV